MRSQNRIDGRERNLRIAEVTICSMTQKTALVKRYEEAEREMRFRCTSVPSGVRAPNLLASDVVSGTVTRARSAPPASRWWHPRDGVQGADAPTLRHTHKPATRTACP
jgi:hypothetical protein